MEIENKKQKRIAYLLFGFYLIFLALADLYYYLTGSYNSTNSSVDEIAAVYPYVAAAISSYSVRKRHKFHGIFKNQQSLGVAGAFRLKTKLYYRFFYFNLTPRHVFVAKKDT